MIPRACVALLLCLICLSTARAEGKLRLTVKETAGIRRFGYPVQVTLTLPRDVTDRDRFRLLADGKPVAAQFRSLANLGRKREVALDFNVNHAPLEEKTWTV